jgi:hypothetical protein
MRHWLLFCRPLLIVTFAFHLQQKKQLRSLARKIQASLLLLRVGLLTSCPGIGE